MPVGCAVRTGQGVGDAGAHGAPYGEPAAGTCMSVGCAVRTGVSTDSEGWSEPWPMASADHAPAPWQLGTVSYLPLAGDGLLLSRLQDGWGLLVERDGGGRERRLAPAFSRFRQLAADAAFFYCIAGAPDRLPAVLAIARDSGAVRILAGGEQPLAAAELSCPAPLGFASGAGERAHAFFYPPRNAACGVPAGEKPPLVLFLHGGPTSACYPVFDPRIQFWTQRGFAVADLNYRGSSGFGRAFRLRLAGEWGRIEVEDAVALVGHLGAQGLIDPARAFIRGASAGGYTALCALAFHDVFRGGASLYGVSDPLALRRATHKFEGDYLDWLIGDPERDGERYAARTPLLHAGRIAAPLIFFQGGLDAVVVPQQTEAMVAALRARGVAVAYRHYAEERHGFRQAANLADALEREWQFYRRLLD
ncbi:prolyl oligopeptidase family serine peptidase [Pseudomonas sp. MAP12]|uniref:Prolyl oligopeptidase family serine peptidase n=2 Tax=Geopseudomonas aromaticivorans TaxID=2849492 RepID=A0ABS6MY54_9GAMM|nr:prolyl oligopeptidase family serine peptidase [Pseudomonas aromaticivorans]